MTAMATTLKLTEFRNSLLQNCEDWIKRFRLIHPALVGWQASTDSLIKGVQQAPDTSSVAPEVKSYFLGAMTESDVLVLVHSTMIQEWHIFLDSIFGEIVLHYLKNNMQSELIKIMVNLKKVRSPDLITMQRTLSEAIKESFSRRAYDDKIGFLYKQFKIKNGNKLKQLQAELKKHVEIRNLFQHSRGIVTEEALGKIGKSPRGYFILLNDKGEKTKYSKGKTIVLFEHEIDVLNKNIADYSKKFEVLS